MEVVAFVMFAALVLAWLIAPNGETKAAPVAAPAQPSMKLGEVSA